MLRSIRLTLVLTLVVALAGLFACAPSDPASRVAKIRNQYTVKLNSWIDLTPEPEPMAAELAADAGEAAGAATAAETAAVGEESEESEGEAMDEEMGPTPTDILFDVVVLREGSASLPGITLDVTHADRNEEIKEVRHHWLDTSKMHRGGTMQVEFKIEGLDFEEGDQFAVEVREYVPPEERAQYREFAETGD